MTCRIGINGFGRIGRMVLRRALTLPNIEIVAVNDRANLGDLAYLCKYDSVHGLFPGEVTHDERSLLVHGTAVQFSSETDPTKIPWGQAGSTSSLNPPGRYAGARMPLGISRPAPARY